MVKLTRLPLSDATLIFVAASRGAGGVGDYAQDLVDELRTHFKHVVEIRDKRADRGSHFRDVVRGVRYLRQLEKSLAGTPLICHFELSAGAILPFWAALMSRAKIKSATVHDPPRPVWWPARIAVLRRFRIANAALHRLFDGVWIRIEKRAMSQLHVVALSDAGIRSIQKWSATKSIAKIAHYVRSSSQGGPITSRPLAVGLFGYPSRSKGYDRIAVFRSFLPDDVLIRVAGRGTEDLQPFEGLEVVGAVEGEDEDAFFGSVRAIILPYKTDSKFVSASGAAMRALSFGVPVIANATEVLSEYAKRGGIRTVYGGLDLLAKETSRLIRDNEDLLNMAREAAEAIEFLGIATIAGEYLRLWQHLVSVEAL